jgi:hypothetical protein
VVDRRIQNLTFSCSLAARRWARSSPCFRGSCRQRLAGRQTRPLGLEPSYRSAESAMSNQSVCPPRACRATCSRSPRRQQAALNKSTDVAALGRLGSSLYCLASLELLTGSGFSSISAFSLGGELLRPPRIAGVAGVRRNSSRRDCSFHISSVRPLICRNWLKAALRSRAVPRLGQAPTMLPLVSSSSSGTARSPHPSPC